MKSYIRLAILVLSLAFFPSLASAADVIVRLVGLEAGEGEARAALFANAAAYAADDRLAGLSEMVKGDSVELVFSNLAPGTYGISAFQDLNENEKIDKNFLGIPKEAYGFSNNARGSFGPPDFEAFSFKVENDSITLEIKLR